MLFISLGVGTGAWVSTTDFLSFPSNAAVICGALKTAGCDVTGLAGKKITPIEVIDPNTAAVIGNRYALEGIGPIGSAPAVGSVLFQFYDNLTGTILPVAVDQVNNQGLGAPTVSSPVAGVVGGMERYFYPINHSALPGNGIQHLSHYRISLDGGATFSQWGPVV
jgi:hypothetical protein